MPIPVERMLHEVLALVIGLMLGSVLPADLLARRRGIDIRMVADGNPGTYNAFRGLGRRAGLITAAYDISVGVVAIQIARLLGTTDGLAYVAGIMAVVGHRFPVFRGLRGGGQGMAASIGMIVYGIVTALVHGWLSPAGLGVLIAIALLAFALMRSGSMVAIVILPVLVIRLAMGHADWQFLAFVSVLAAHVWIVQAALAQHWRPLRRARSADDRA